MFVSEIEQHLKQKIIPFWESLKDTQYGGYYGYLDYNLVLDKYAVKGCILNSRILWFFSNAYMLLKEEHLLENANHAWEFLKKYCMDKENGGIYWSVTYNGKIDDSTKHTYNQAFAIYALSSYYDASGNIEALELAKQIYKIIETKCKDEYGYLESFNIRFEEEKNDKLSENGVMAEKTMNTLLHTFEAYTELYRVTKDEDVAKNIRFMLDLFVKKIYNPEIGRQEVFFDKKWNVIIDLYSYGHDIETSWLIDRGLEILGDEEYKQKLSSIIKALAQNIYKNAYVDNSVVNEAERGIVNTTRVWWVQAEAVVGFLNAYQKYPNEKQYLEAAENIWGYIRDYMVDSRENSEWFWALDKDRKPIEKPIVEPWKCPYHNGRMCIEVIRRSKNVK